MDRHMHVFMVGSDQIKHEREEVGIEMMLWKWAEPRGLARHSLI